MIEIDKDKTYYVGDYSFTNYINLSHDSLKLLLDWRNHEEVRKWMYNSDIISLDNHLAFASKLASRDDAYYWMVYDKNEPVGSVNITNVDTVNGIGELGMYYRPDQVNHSPFGIDYVYSLYDFVINTLHFQQIKGGIREDNPSSLMLTLFMGAEKMGMVTVDGVNYIHTLVSSEKFKVLSADDLSVKSYLKFIRKQLKK